MSDLCKKIENFGKGIGNTSRYRIVEALYKGSRTVTQLTKTVKKSQPLISQHLKILKANSIVIDNRRGKEVFYSLNSKYVVGLLKNLSKEIGQCKK